MTQPDLARAPARAPCDLSGSSASSRSMTPTAFAVKATAGKLPPGEGGASPCSAGLAAKPLHHAAATFTHPLGAGAVAKALHHVRGRWSASTAWRRRRHRHRPAVTVRAAAPSCSYFI